MPAEDLAAETARHAVELAAGPTADIGRAKRLLWLADSALDARQIEEERLCQIEKSSSGDFAEGLTAFVEKRAPCFRGR